MWILLLIFLSGPLAGEKFEYREQGVPVAHRFENFEACKAMALKQGPQLQEALKASPGGDEHEFALRCVPDETSAKL